MGVQTQIDQLNGICRNRQPPVVQFFLTGDVVGLIVDASGVPLPTRDTVRAGRGRLRGHAARWFRTRAGTVPVAV